MCRLAACIRGWRQKLLDSGFQDLVFEDVMDLLLQVLNQVCT